MPDVPLDSFSGGRGGSGDGREFLVEVHRKSSPLEHGVDDTVTDILGQRVVGIAVLDILGGPGRSGGGRGPVYESREIGMVVSGTDICGVLSSRRGDAGQIHDFDDAEALAVDRVAPSDTDTRTVHSSFGSDGGPVDADCGPQAGVRRGLAPSSDTCCSVPS